MNQRQVPPLRTCCTVSVPHQVMTALAAASLLGSAGCAGPGGVAGSNSPDKTAASSSDPVTASAPDSGVTVKKYADGEYTQVGGYVSPGGNEEIGITLTVKDDVVTAISTEPMPSNPTAKLYQERFSGGIQDQIVGVRLDDLAVEKVAGSSLTSGGFAQAAEKIKSEARK